MSDYGSGGTRPEDDYHRARQEADRANNDYEGNQAWKKAQDEMYRAQQEMEWQRRDAQSRNASGDDWSYKPQSTDGSITTSGPQTVLGAFSPRGHRVSFAVADGLAQGVAGALRVHPGLFMYFFRAIAWAICLPIPLAQRALDRFGIRSRFLRFPLLLAIWMVYLLILSAIILRSNGA
jgi:hypothetical protein